MKRFVRFALLTLVLLAMAAVPAFADDGGQVITGRNVMVTPDSPIYGYLVVLGGNADIQAGGVVNGIVAVVGGNEVINPFVVTEVYVQQGEEWKLASMSFTRLLGQ